MKYLLDSHTLLYALFSPAKLGTEAHGILVNPESEIHVSTVTFWELSLKYGIGKLDLSGVTPERLPAECARLGFATLALDAECASSFHRLPRLEHRDPFDQMLAWQAIRGGMVLVSADAALSEYRRQGLRTVW